MFFKTAPAAVSEKAPLPAGVALIRPIRDNPREASVCDARWLALPDLPSDLARGRAVGVHIDVHLPGVEQPMQ